MAVLHALRASVVNRMQTLSDPGRLAPVYLLDPPAKVMLAGL